MLTTNVAAQTRTVGVNVDDWFKYTITVRGNSSSLNNTYDVFKWMKVQITGVSGTNVTGQTTIHYQNESETTNDGWVDVETGNGGGSSGGLTGFVLAANLGVGDTIYTNPIPLPGSITINSTADRTYPGGARATNHAQYTSNSASGSLVLDYYWDKLTGAMVETDYNITAQQGADTVVMSLQYILADSGAWVVPEFSSMLMLALFVTFTLVAVIYKRKQPRIFSR